MKRSRSSDIGLRETSVADGNPKHTVIK